MKKNGKHRSVTQNYIDLSDFLAAARSLLGLLYTVITAALIVSCMMYVFFDIIPVKGKYNLSGEEVRVIVQVRGYCAEKDSVVVIQGSRLCAEVLDTDELKKLNGDKLQPADNELLVSISEVNGSKTVKLITQDEIEGRVVLILSPMNTFGNNFNKLL